MAGVADATLLPPYLRLISDKHIYFYSSTLTLSISHLGEPRLQYGLSISACRAAVRGLWAQPRRSDIL
jgi:hypothetical protein